MSDYEQIERVLRYLDEKRLEQPGPMELAAGVGLSEKLLSRLFLRWAAVTPQDFLQSLTPLHLRGLLLRGGNVFKSECAAGLPGTGISHDLCITMEPVAPRKIESGKKTCEIAFGFGETPFGKAILGEGPLGICHLAFFDAGEEADALHSLEESWPEAAIVRKDSAARQKLELIFQRESLTGHAGGLRAFVRGTPFQLRVWNALLCVRSGTLTTYGRLAEAIGQAGAARAVGSAVGGNLLGYLIPCHRVIRETGIVGGYRWGRVRKQAMLAWESSLQ